MSVPVLVALGFVVLGGVALPLPFIRQATLHLGWLAARLALVAVAPVAALFAYQPDLAPEPLAAFVTAALPEASGEIRWLAVATGTVLAGLPLVVVLDHARRLARHTALVEHLHHDLDAFRAETVSGPPVRPVAASAPNHKPLRTAGPPRLVRDALHQNAHPESL
jgi:hypothetical protein